MTSAIHDQVLLPGGTFTMGSDEFYPDEQPVHEREVAPFRIDRYAVTNEQYAAFVDDTGYVTVAERELDPANFEGADPADLVPGAMVFTPTPGPVDLRDWRNWWRWQPGAYWRRPFGPESSIDERLRHPVVHIAFEDAQAYARWAGLRLPTETEHEYAARGGLDGKRFAWGDEPYPGGVPQANSWLGRFPYDNQGVGDAAPVGSYEPNGFGLYDMTGNVWEWTTDFYTPRHLRLSDKPVDAGKRANLLAAASAQDGFPSIPRRVLKGGSHLCSPDYCLRFRPAARSPQAEDTGMSHIGFRLVGDV
ncbi:formylglycine-generating enzyme family protein [Microbacterium kyungheense]|uniref:Formylglycine-generating enzyme required for sulfatase activity n=1 Tax=Microbacterium kyungheense TaxID=1263636 RepID=A0A543EEZ5_9MICO|nr:formylglycine-generating enzyme family protein [Microbacterium kyungheense]TQM18574.1 formylglycine-generating enzyme required for sulfatase activity [Microbacterium kyungheense]TQM20116.1 formylglycine-generating enzyme required for sulfatase activity [Microbacterium kyungheense]